jgi:hypothetical protein
MILCRRQPVDGIVSRQHHGEVKKVAVPGDGVKRLVGSVVRDPGLCVGAVDFKEWLDRKVVAQDAWPFVKKAELQCRPGLKEIECPGKSVSYNPV